MHDMPLTTVDPAVDAPHLRRGTDRATLPGPDDLPALARRLYEFGQRRARFLPAGLFGEPGWNILLDLYASHAEGVAISVTSASIASGAPVTTGLRTVRMLEAEGLVARGRAGSDRRRSDLMLTPAGRAAVEQALCELRPVFGHLLSGSPGGEAL